MNYIYRTISFLVLAVLFIGCGSSNKYPSSQSCFAETRSIFKNINAPVFTSTSSVNIYEGNKDVSTIVATPNNGGTISYVICGRGSEFFNINSSNGKITFRDGVTSKFSDRSSYKIIVKAIDSNDSRLSSQTFTINILTVAPAVPSIANIVATQTLTKDTAITGTGLNVTNTGGAIASCSITTGTLPAGLNINNTTCAITGTPTAIKTSEQYTITATNATGSDTATVTIIVNDKAPIIANADDKTFTSGTAITSFSFANTGGAIVSCQVTTGTLPSGLSINNACQISGIPNSGAVSETIYTVTATNTGGENTATVKITVNPAPVILLAPIIENISTTQTLTKDTAITGTGLNVTRTGGAIASCSITTGTLPAGLSIDNNTCAITGTPTERKASEQYTITATNATGSDTATVTIIVKDKAPIIADTILSTIFPTQSVGSSYILDFPSEPWKFGNTGGDITNCEINATLPSGLIFNTTTCEITGTPTSQVLDYYTITGSNADGVKSNDLEIYVHVKRKDLGIMDISKELIVDQAMTPIQFAPEILYCVISPSLPSGLTLLVNKTNETCKITGTPTSTQVSTVYTVTAMNAVSGGSATVTIVVKPSPPNIADITTNKNLPAGIEITPIQFTNTGETPTSCSSTPSLPTGLTIGKNGNTCAISGTAPSFAVALREYNITATNSGSEDNASINIAITVDIGRLKTGQTTVYKTNDDGTYKKGITRGFTRNSNKVVDNVTKLEWQDDSDHNNTGYIHSNAITHCQGLTLDGNSDWELPTINELLTIVDYGKSNQSINGTFANTSSSKYWSATPVDSSRAWYVNFDSGSMNSNTKSSSLYVRCVRARQ